MTAHIARRIAAVLVLAALGAPSALAQVARLHDGNDGATCTHFNLGAALFWKHKLGDWIDAKGVSQGQTPLAQVALAEADRKSLAQWDVTAALKTLPAGNGRRLALLLSAMPGQGTGQRLAEFYSREHPTVTDRPTLAVEFADGRKDYLWPSADTVADCTTNRGIGDRPTLLAGGGRTLMIEFDFARAEEKSRIVAATLQLVRTPRRFGDVTVGAFLLDTPRETSGAAPQNGIAARHPGDRGIERDPDVYMATGFDDARWKDQWTTIGLYGRAPTFDAVERDEVLQFPPIAGKALRVRIPRGSNLGLDLRYEFQKKQRAEPEEVYFRYYLWLARDWQPSDTGKLPGIAGTYGKAGWGERGSDGTSGWSLRGTYYTAPAKDNPLHAFVTAGSYAYHAEPAGQDGEMWPWTLGLHGLLARERWYAIEQYVRMNTPKAKDGIVRVWVNGKLAFERTDIRFRDVPSLKVEYVWMNVYHGGRTPAPQDLHLFIDNVVIARRYIGPMAGG